MDQRMKYSYAAVCATGRVRTENQDRIYLNGTICGGGYAQTDGTGRKQGLFAVADGMGGQAQGAQAAQAALKALPPKKCWSPEAVLQAYDAGNRAICDQIGKIGKRSGATLTTLLLADGEAYAANIGDSRCYLYRDGCLSRLSEDHTAVQRLIALGIIEPAEAKTHPERHRLTQHLGIFPDELIIQPHTVQLPVRPGDRFMLCSDGLTICWRRKTSARSCAVRQQRRPAPPHCTSWRCSAAGRTIFPCFSWGSTAEAAQNAQNAAPGRARRLCAYIRKNSSTSTTAQQPTAT